MGLLLREEEDAKIEISYFFGDKPKEMEDPRITFRRKTEDSLLQINDDNLKERISKMNKLI